MQVGLGELVRVVAEAVPTAAAIQTDGRLDDDAHGVDQAATACCRGGEAAGVAGRGGDNVRGVQSGGLGGGLGGGARRVDSRLGGQLKGLTAVAGPVGL